MKNFIRRSSHSAIPGSRSIELHQAQKFADAGLDWSQACHIAAQTVLKNGIPRTDPSNHYEIFAAISQIISPSSILEIGTHRGVFTAFLASLWSDARIVTYELPPKQFLPKGLTAASDLSRHYVTHFDSDAAYRDSLFARFPNIELRLEDSTSLMNSTETFDVSWIDGDHRYPVVAFDVSNVVRLCRLGGWIGVDDIRLRSLIASNELMGSTEGHETVQRVSAAGLAEMHLVLKRGQNIPSDHDLSDHKHIAILRKL